MTLTTEEITKIVQHIVGNLDFKVYDQKSDDLETDWDHFVSQRRYSYEPESTQKYQDIEERRQHLEASIVCLIRNPSDKQIAQKTFEDIEECFFNRENESNGYEFERGLMEGFILAFNLLAPRLTDMIKE
jgi:hypothetical protein